MGKIFPEATEGLNQRISGTKKATCPSSWVDTAPGVVLTFCGRGVCLRPQSSSLVVSQKAAASLGPRVWDMPFAKAGDRERPLHMRRNSILPMRRKEDARSFWSPSLYGAACTSPQRTPIHLKSWEAREKRRGIETSSCGVVQNSHPPGPRLSDVGMPCLHPHPKTSRPLPLCPPLFGLLCLVSSPILGFGYKAFAASCCCTAVLHA